MTFTPKETAGYLEHMGYDATYIDQTLTVRVPSYRTDIMHPIDLVEDVAIAYGYDRFVPEIPAEASVAGEDPLEVFSRGLRNFLVGFGFLEVMTFMMSNREKLFHRMRLAEEPIAETENPKIEDYTVLRNRLLPSLIEVLSVNKHHPYPQNLYEVGDVVRLDPTTETGARSSRRLAIVLCHAKANFSEIKGVLESILQNLEQPYDVQEGGLSCFIEGRRFMATVNQAPLCWAGEIRPDVLDAWAIEMPMAALELDVDRLFHLVTNRDRPNTDLAR
jgi:phenylalanyl-tRNA synthetase beta chain